MFAFIEAVKAQYTLGDFYSACRFAAAFAVSFTQAAVNALPGIFSNSPNCKTIEYSKQCSEGADESTVKAGNDKIKQNGGKENS